ncbi:MAG TPA: transposase [Thermoguttaceae bacterium]|nr:transposase [Thermoguttaceae bacterium]
MSSHVFHEIYLHVNWHVKDDRPTLNPDIERLVWGLIKDRCRRIKGVYFHGIGGTETHVHLAFNIEPDVTISELVKDLKGGSSHDLNAQLGRKELYWQRGYGASGRAIWTGCSGTSPIRRSIMPRAARRTGWSESRRMRMRRTEMSEDSTRSPAEAGLPWRGFSPFPPAKAGGRQGVG